MPAAPVHAPPTPFGHWNLATKIGVAAAVLILGFCVIALLAHRNRPFDHLTFPEPPQQVVAQVPDDNAPPPPDLPLTPQPAVTPEAVSPATFGPVIERELQARAAGTNQFLNLETQQLLTPPPEIASALDSPDGNDGNAWEALGIPQDSPRFRYIRWLQESGADLMFAGDGKLIGFDGIFPIAHGADSANWDNWDSLTPDQARAAVAVVDWTRRAAQAQAQGQPTPPMPKAGGLVNSAAQLDSREPGGPVVNVLTREQSVNYYFKTRSGKLGILQLAEVGGNPAVARIRYKLISSGSGPDPSSSSDFGKLRRDQLAGCQ
jgi:hypothetical protein